MSEHDHWEKNLVELYDVISANLQSQNISNAESAAEKLVIALSAQFGGLPFYIGKRVKAETALRHQQIWREFDGRNHAELARKYDLTLQQIYIIVREQRKADSPQQPLL